MADEERNAESTETPEERTEQVETDSTPEEAHREGEFEDLLRRIESLQSSVADVITTVEGLKTNLGSFTATAIDNGAEVRSTDGKSGDLDSEISEDSVEVIPDYSDMNLSM